MLSSNLRASNSEASAVSQENNVLIQSTISRSLARDKKAAATAFIAATSVRLVQAKGTFSLAGTASHRRNRSGSRTCAITDCLEWAQQQHRSSAGGMGTECPHADSSNTSGSCCPCVKLWPEFRDQKSLEGLGFANYPKWAKFRIAVQLLHSCGVAALSAAQC